MKRNLDFPFQKRIAPLTEAGCRQPELFARAEDRAGLRPVGWGIRTARGVVLAQSCEAWSWQSGRQVTTEGACTVRVTPGHISGRGERHW